MIEKLETAIEIVLGLVRTNSKPEDVVKVTQAAKNLAETRQLLLLSSKK